MWPSGVGTAPMPVYISRATRGKTFSTRHVLEDANSSDRIPSLRCGMTNEGDGVALRDGWIDWSLSAGKKRVALAGAQNFCDARYAEG
jgi:hypothetical protein